MQQVIVDCSKKEEVRQDLTPQEESQRLAEIQQAIADKVASDKRANKALLVKALMELREMRQNRDVFTDEDIGEKQAEVDELKQKVRE